MAEKHLLKNKVAIVTGGAAGIGYAISSEFAKEGAKVVIAELREDRGIQSAKEIGAATGAEVKAICTDVRDEAQIIRCVEKTVEAFGRVDILINNASKEKLVDASDMLMAQRAHKTAAEQEKLRIVNEISAFGLEPFMRGVDVGVSGIDLATAVESAIVKKGTGYKGARRVRAFAQVSTGLEACAMAYRPMVVSTNVPLASGDPALLELAVVADGFWCDRTRVAVAGEATAAQQAAIGAVREAQAAAIAAVKPGVTAGEVDKAARDVIHAAGFTDDEFLHVTGHGLGFRYHEPTPLICPGGDTVLEEGMVHTVEPGVYRADFGGFRIEDNVLVTADGAEVLGGGKS